MEQERIGILIRNLRKEMNLTQQQLAEKLCISDKAISKWERGMGCPDVSLLPTLSGILGVDLETLLSGDLGARETSHGNMKKMQFSVCPVCGNLITALESTAISCCGKKLKPLTAQKADDAEKLSIELIENDYFITSGHPMKREHYISFVALLTEDTIVFRKLYPEWALQVRIPVLAHGKLLWYCTRHGLWEQEV